MNLDYIIKSRLKKEFMYTSDQYQELYKKANLAILAARIDVSKKNLETIVNEINSKFTRFGDVLEFAKRKFFIGENAKHYHMSPFGVVETIAKTNYFSDRFKGGKHITLRHILEEIFDLDKYYGLRIMDEFYEKYKDIKLKPLKIMDEIELDNEVVHFNDDKERVEKQKLYLIDMDTKNNVMAVIWLYASRVATHQLVRHQSFNYQQQSQRYVKFDNARFYLPSSIYKETKKEYIKTYKQQLEKYIDLTKRGIKKEDARFVFPMAVTSNIFIEGLIQGINNRDGFKEFVEKRNIEQAQEEIRNFAKGIGKILERYISKESDYSYESLINVQ